MENTRIVSGLEVHQAFYNPIQNLISAAPELLACVEDFLECGPNAGHNQELLIKCRAAVAKAKGE